MVTGRINGKEILINNAEDLNLNFESSTQGVNTTFSSSFLPEFVEMRNRGSVDPYSTVLDAIKSAPFPSKIPFNLVSRTGDVFKGSLLPYSSSNEFGADNPKQLKVQWEYNKIDFFGQANALSISKFINRSDYDKVRYIRENVPNYLEVLFIVIASTIMGIEVIKQVEAVYQATKDFISALTPDGAPVPLPDFLKAAVISAFDVIIQAAVLILLLIVLNDLLKALSENLFQKPRSYYWLNVKTILEKGCAELGLQFESSFFNGVFKDLNILTATTKQGTLKSAPSNNPIPQKTLGQFITEWAAVFNAKIRVNNEGVVKMEPQSYFRNEQPVSSKQLQKNYLTSTYSFNTEELIRRLKIEYQSVDNDSHFDLNILEVTYDNKLVNLKDLGIDGNLEVRLPFAIAKRKDRTDDLAKLFNKIFDFFSGLSGRYKIKGGDRTGYMLLQNDFVSVDLIGFRDGNEKIKDKAEDYLSPLVIYQNYYQSEVAPYNNQYANYKRITEQPQFNLSDLVSLADNPNLRDEDGNIIQITRSSFEDETGVSGFEYTRKVKAGELGYINPDDFKEIISLK